jgi:hypothetical protein
MSGETPRICVVTARGFSRQAFMAGAYDAEDILVEIANAQLIHPKPRGAHQFRKQTHARLVWHDFTKSLAFANVAFEPVTLTREYDLLVAYLLNDIDHLFHVSAIREWKNHCKTSVCWIDEIYAVDVPRLKNWLPALAQFDHIVVGYKGSVSALSQALNRRCHWVPSGVDAIRFTPSPGFPDRVVDVYNMGRRVERLHRALLDLTTKNGMFYLYDTFESSRTALYDYKQHRDMLANIMKRTRYFTVFPAKGGVAQATGNQIELGYRYYEASAAGNVMLGPIPRTEAFETMFDWQDAVVEINPDGSDIADIISNLAAQPERLIEISRRNTVQALRRHDWAYRWKKVLEIANVDPAPELEIREGKLTQLAERAGNA